VAEEGLAALGINPIYLIGQIVNFSILVFVLGKLLYGPVLRKLDERAKTTKKSLETAEKALEDQEKWRLKQEEEMERVQKQQAAFLKDAQEQAEKERQAIIEAAKTEAEVAAQNEYRKFEQKLHDQEEKLQGKIADLVVATTRKILTTHLDPKTHAALIKKQLESIKKLPV
jgi:F-type H+-transporting ATPase subunit b